MATKPSYTVRLTEDQIDALVWAAFDADALDKTRHTSSALAGRRRARQTAVKKLEAILDAED